MKTILQIGPLLASIFVLIYRAVYFSYIDNSDILGMARLLFLDSVI